MGGPRAGAQPIFPEEQGPRAGRGRGRSFLEKAVVPCPRPHHQKTLSPEPQGWKGEGVPRYCSGCYPWSRPEDPRSVEFHARPPQGWEQMGAGVLSRWAGQGRAVRSLLSRAPCVCRVKRPAPLDLLLLTETSTLGLHSHRAFLAKTPLETGSSLPVRLCPPVFRSGSEGATGGVASRL